MMKKPSVLSQTAQKMWEKGGVEDVDRADWAIYVQFVADFIDVEQRIDASGRVLETESGNLELNPLAHVSQFLAERALTFAQRAGLTPGARSRLMGMTPQEAAEAERIFNQLVGGLEGKIAVEGLAEYAVALAEYRAAELRLKKSAQAVYGDAAGGLLGYEKAPKEGKKGD